MSKPQKLLYPIIIIALVVLALVFWGSIASILFILCAISGVVMYFWQRFLINGENSDMMDNENG